jgi:2-phospho-L-lactate guanylyltransferase
MPRADAAVLVPIKAFGAAKVRLAPALDAAARESLARRMAATVLAAAGDLPRLVVCDDEDVRAWAADHGAEVAWTPGLGLDGAVTAGLDRLRSKGVARAIIAHADLPLATDLAWVADFDGVTLVPDRRLDGTNVLGVPTDAGFTVSYGPGSFTRHRAEAARLGLTARIVKDPHLSWDVDLPPDLDLPASPTVTRT